ncbi:hypothetical protein PR244_00480 [Metamycoplasma hyosynoviae]|uniref:hypothetical protein n=1 Tax=Metamycoplasma hyosynoviae TaxID=29559 RepID=UPI002359D137|nr:hypothetical protein [Metamycoplasma hyosynoviae]MDC8918839.1 hypothetical protein [Metamycoplasma hyosynoviae]
MEEQEKINIYTEDRKIIIGNNEHKAEFYVMFSIIEANVEYLIVTNGKNLFLVLKDDEKASEYVVVENEDENLVFEDLITEFLENNDVKVIDDPNTQLLTIFKSQQVEE